MKTIGVWCTFHTHKIQIEGSSYGTGIKIIDITSERRPSRRDSLKINFAKDLVILGSGLFVADVDGFKVVKILIPSWLQ